MKKTKGTGAMLFSMIAVIVIICLFIVAGNGAKKEAASKEIRVGLLLSAHFALILKKRLKNMSGRKASR